MKIRKILIFSSAFAVLSLIGAGCNRLGPQAEINSPTFGTAGAPVEIVEYSDFQCPGCKIAETSVVPFVIEDYVNTGKATLTFKNLAFIGEESILSAEAALCSQEQGKFMEYSQKLFEAQGAENSGVFTNDKLKSIASSLGLDTASFNSCLDNEKYNSQVKKETEDAFASGITGSPTFVINGQKIQSSSYLSVKRAIDKKLEEVTQK